MPSFVNIGAYVDEGTMVDTWATVGSCAQIGKNVHLSGGVGIGGVLEPSRRTRHHRGQLLHRRALRDREGVIVEENSVISMAYSSARACASWIAPPARSCTAGCRPARWWFQEVFPPGRQIQPLLRGDCKRVDAKTRSTTSLNDLLRGD